MSALKNNFYRLIDLLTLNKGVSRNISGHKIYFPAKWSRYFEADYEQENIRFLSQHCKKGMTVVDIGAHLGLISAIASQLTGHEGAIYAFEPTPSTFEVLQKVIRLNSPGRTIHPFRVAVSSFSGEFDFFVDEHEGSNANSLVKRQDKSRNSQKTRVLTLDQFVSDEKLTALHILKIDAEGSELDVLAGAKETILRFRPKIVLAIHPQLVKNNDQTTEAIYGLIKELGYLIHYKDKVLDKESFCGKTDFFDVHLIPENK